MLRSKNLQNSGPLAVLGALATATGGDELANGFHCGLSHQDVAVMEVATDGKPRYKKWIPTGIPTVNGSKKGVDPRHSPIKPWFLDVSGGCVKIRNIEWKGWSESPWDWWKSHSATVQRQGTEGPGPTVPKRRCLWPLPLSPKGTGLPTDLEDTSCAWYRLGVRCQELRRSQMDDGWLWYTYTITYLLYVCMYIYIYIICIMVYHGISWYRSK